MIAKKAYDILKKENPSALQKAELILRDYNDPTTRKNERNFPFVECATWADEIKWHGGRWQGTWHYDDTPLFSDDTPRSRFRIRKTNKNITAVMPELYQWLRGQPNKRSFVYKTIMKHAKTEQEGRSIALRLLIHFYGDIHQPFHLVSKFDKKHLRGDYGGNLFYLKYHYGAKNLHSVWDRAVYINHKFIRKPFSNYSIVKFGKLTNLYMGGVSVSPSQYQTLNFHQFGEESYAIAKHAYDGLTSGKRQVIPKDYQRKYVPIAREQAVLAAYRLAYMIEQVYG